jgi:hypothetical protein
MSIFRLTGTGRFFGLSGVSGMIGEFAELISYFRHLASTWSRPAGKQAMPD